MKHIKRHLTAIGLCLLFTILLVYPYFRLNLLPVEHDTFFHVSRIEQLARSIREGNILPAVYPYENNGFGYASPLFYSDVLLIPSALLHLCGISVSICYKITVIAASFFSGLSMYALAYGIVKRRDTSVLAACAYLFTNYRITDIYVRGALGELLALIFLPLMILGMYSIMIKKKTETWPLLTFALSGLALSHNLTFLMGAILCAIIFFVYIRENSREIFITLCKGIGSAFLLTAFYTLPMIEQLRSQEFIVGYYAEHSDLAKYAMAFWQYFANTTVFGLAGNHMAPEVTMIENVGWFLTFIPLLWFVIGKENRNRHRFLNFMVIAGIVCILLPAKIIPWQSLTILRVMQFPWRFNTLAIVLLSVPAAYIISANFEHHAVTALFCILLSLEGIWHVHPVMERTFGIPDTMSWQEVQQGALCDPYYSAYYMRVELAGGDYLPLHSPDFRGRSTGILYEDGNETGYQIMRNKDTLTFEITDHKQQLLILPLTWYKGYQIHQIIDDEQVPIPCQSSSSGLVTASVNGSGTYVCRYISTPFRKLCIAISALSAVLLVILSLLAHSSFDA